jgi:S-adenosylmethionine:tRNA ribosyltransferase-isomerase
MPFFEYDLPAELIAQQPCAERDQSRLLVLRRSNSAIEHRIFADLPALLSPGDLLVLNDTRVVPARLIGRRAGTGGKWEGLFLRGHAEGLWELLCQTRGRLAPGEMIDIEPGPLKLELVSKTVERHWLARPSDVTHWADVLARHGQVPLPPYIRKGRASQDDAQRYQTVFAQQPGAVAAPTAGLHFTPTLFERLAARGVGVTQVTLHVGPGTFQPIQVEDFRHHRMHREWGEVPAEACTRITECRQNRGRVIAVGTTAVRVLETVAALGPLRPWQGETELFVYPPYEFKIVDALITNFHLPRSTLLLLVGAFAGEESLRKAYNTAIEQRYRFYSYGDAMLVL